MNVKSNQLISNPSNEGGGRGSHLWAAKRSARTVKKKKKKNSSDAASFGREEKGGKESIRQGTDNTGLRIKLLA